MMAVAKPIYEEDLGTENPYIKEEKKFEGNCDKLYRIARCMKDIELKKKLIDILHEANKIKKDPPNCIQQLNDILECILQTMILGEKLNAPSHNEDFLTDYSKKINKLLEYSEQVNGKSSVKRKAFGILLMGIATLLIASSALSVAFGISTLIPSMGTSVLLSLFGLSPALAGVYLFQYGYKKFKSGCQTSLAKRLSLFAHSLSPKKPILFSESSEQTTQLSKDSKTVVIVVGKGSEAITDHVVNTRQNL